MGLIGRFIVQSRVSFDRYIRDNYSRIKNVENELEKVQFELKMAAGPKQSALEMLRKKIEQENEVVMRARARCKLYAFKHKDLASKIWLVWARVKAQECFVR